MTIVCAGGGTGGHLYPAVALAQKIKSLNPDSRIQFIGTRRGLESQVVPKMGFPLTYISVKGWARGRTLENLFVPFQLIWSIFQCLRLYAGIKPDAVIGTGGYVSAPALFAAILCRYPTLIQEQNSHPGVTTRLLARWADQVHLSFTQSKIFFKRQDNVRVSGNPVREFRLEISRQEARRHFHLSQDRPTLFVFGGSQGAAALNRTLLACLEKLMAETAVQLIWATGHATLSEVQQATATFTGRVHIFPFTAEIEMAYAACDIVICRAGALTLAEIALWGLPAILIPYPFAAANHQETNARMMEDCGAAQVILEKEITAQKLFNIIQLLLSDTARRREMSQAAHKAAFPNATGTIVTALYELVERKRASGR
jgi:UDP-N-acetylglucosamine--N-acetylmuramyl-(pentapeptide) pyrophosphoryl-undecaprenol N-acetylglucosamine transferase